VKFPRVCGKVALIQNANSDRGVDIKRTVILLMIVALLLASVAGCAGPMSGQKRGSSDGTTMQKR